MTSSSVWPYDVLTQASISLPEKLTRRSPYELTCLLLCPLLPKKDADDTLGLLVEITGIIGKELACKIKCLRADLLASPGVIHNEIWEMIRTSDVIVVDVTGFNPNVIYEFGVVAASRKKEHIIVIKNDDVKEGISYFDFSPVRQLRYSKDVIGDRDFHSRLYHSLMTAFTSAPFEIAGEDVSLPFPIEVNFEEEKRDVKWLISPPITHRVLKDGYLEFGSLYIYKNSWMSVGSKEFSNVKVSTQIRFVQPLQPLNWIGIAVRSSHYHANFGYILYVGTNGHVTYTRPLNDKGKYENVDIGKIKEFTEKNQHEFLSFEISIDDHNLNMKVNELKKVVPMATLPHVFHSGHVLVQTCKSRVGIRSLMAEEI